MKEDEHLRYEASDSPPGPLTAGLGLQLAVLSLNSAVMLPTIVFVAAGAERILLWAIFAGMMTCGIITALHAVGVGRFGAGYLMLQGVSSPFIAVCVAALIQGGPSTLATLVLVTGLAQAAFSDRLALLHRLLTPVVTGTVIMLLPVTVMPILFRMLNELPAGAPTLAAPLSALVTLAVAVGIHLTGTGALRLWAPATGIAAGSVVAAFFGIYDTGFVADAAWLGLPSGRPPGLDLSFGPAFWSLLPAFLFIALVGATKSVGVAVATQRVSWRRPRAVDFRSVQGAVAGQGLGNVLGGLTGAIPNTLHPTPIAMIETTGVAARRVGVAAGLALVVLACVPKLVAVIVAIPDAVMAASIAVVMSMLFAAGMREVVSGGGTNPRNGLIAGFSVWVGIAIEFDLVFPEFFADFVGGLLSNGMATGGLVAILLTALTMPRVARFGGTVDVADLPEIRGFIRDFARRRGLEASVERMEAASEETLLMLVDARDAETVAGDVPEQAPRSLLVTASREAGDAVLQFKAAAAGQEELNLQDRLEWLGDEAEGEPEEQQMSLRLLRHLASSVRHQQFRNVEIVTLRVSADPRADGQH